MQAYYLAQLSQMPKQFKQKIKPIFKTKNYGNNIQKNPLRRNRFGK